MDNAVCQIVPFFIKFPVSIDMLLDDIYYVKLTLNH